MGRRWERRGEGKGNYVGEAASISEGG